MSRISFGVPCGKRLLQTRTGQVPSQRRCVSQEGLRTEKQTAGRRYHSGAAPLFRLNRAHGRWTDAIVPIDRRPPTAIWWEVAIRWSFFVGRRSPVVCQRDVRPIRLLCTDPIPQTTNDKRRTPFDMLVVCRRSLVRATYDRFAFSARTQSHKQRTTYEHPAPLVASWLNPKTTPVRSYPPARSSPRPAVVAATGTTPARRSQGGT